MRASVTSTCDLAPMADADYERAEVARGVGGVAAGVARAPGGTARATGGIAAVYSQVYSRVDS